MTGPSRKRLRDASTPLLAGALAVALTAACLAAVCTGSTSTGPAELARWVADGMPEGATATILCGIRIPRVAAALLAGAALAAAGAIIQAVLDNPLASPNIIGINSGAGLAVLLAASLLPHAPWVPPLAAFAGALAAAGAVFAISLHAGASRLTVVLAGIAITTVFGAGMNTVLIVDPDAYVGSSAFLTGGLSGVLLKDLMWPAALIFAGCVAAIAFAPLLNILALGDDSARSLGLNTIAVRLGLLAVASMLAGAAVSFAGLLGFVGLVVPHAVRMATGADNRKTVPLSMIAGAATVVACDALTRTMFAPYEVPVGIFMAFIGGPFFIYLILRNRRGGLD